MPIYRRGHALVLRDAGHVADLWYGRADGDRRIVRFLATGEVDTPADEPMRYRVSIGPATIMKGMLALASLLLLGLLMLLLRSR